MPVVCRFSGPLPSASRTRSPQRCAVRYNGRCLVYRSCPGWSTRTPSVWFLNSAPETLPGSTHPRTPIGSAQDIEIPIVGAHLEERVRGSIPLVEHLLDHES